MPSKKPTKPVNPRAAAAAYAARSAEVPPAPVVEPALPPRRLTGGFWLGFLLVLAALLLMLGRTVIEWLGTPTAATPEQTLPFNEVHRQVEAWQQAQQQAGLSPQQVTIELFPHNPTEGPARAITVVEFIDLGCLACRAEIASLTALRQQYNNQVRFVSKLLPDNDRALSAEASLFALIAAENNVYWPFRDAVSLTAQEGVAYYTSVLESLGVPLRVVRNRLSQGQEELLAQLRQDTLLAQNLNLKTATSVFIDGYQLGQAGLPKADAEKILLRLQAGEGPVPQVQ